MAGKLRHNGAEVAPGRDSVRMVMALPGTVLR